MVERSFRVTGSSHGGGTLRIGSVDGSGPVDIAVSCIDSEPVATIVAELTKQALLVKQDAGELRLEHCRLTDRHLPALACYPAGARGLPLVIFVHGLGGNKAVDIREALQFAQAGFFTLVLDAAEHGERQPEDYARRFEKDRLVGSFFRVLIATVDDIRYLIDLMESDPRVEIRRIGMSGVSMGGFITFLAVARDKRIVAAAPLIGSPDWSAIDDAEGLPKIDPAAREVLEREQPLGNFRAIPPTALLVQNGVDDPVVPVSGVRRLDERLRPLYARMPDRYRFIEYPGVGHEVRPEMVDRAIEWFRKHLGRGPA